MSIELAEATLYADDQIKEQVSVFKGGTITAGIDDDNDKVFAELLGQTVDEESGLVTSNVNDEPIYVGFGHIVPKMVGGARKYKVEFFPKTKFKPFMTDAKTKGDSLEFTTPSVEATIFEDTDGNWEKRGSNDIWRENKARGRERIQTSNIANKFRFKGIFLRNREVNG